MTTGRPTPFPGPALRPSVRGPEPPAATAVLPVLSV